MMIKHLGKDPYQHFFAASEDHSIQINYHICSQGEQILLPNIPNAFCAVAVVWGQAQIRKSYLTEGNILILPAGTEASLIAKERTAVAIVSVALIEPFESDTMPQRDQVCQLSDFTGGWFLGDFSPAIWRTNKLECAVKTYSAGEKEQRHYHRIATEVTIVAAGRVRLNGTEYCPGDILTLSPGEPADFEALTNATNFVIKTPSIVGDKYIVEV